MFANRPLFTALALLTVTASGCLGGSGSDSTAGPASGSGPDDSRLNDPRADPSNLNLGELVGQGAKFVEDEVSAWVADQYGVSASAHAETTAFGTKESAASDSSLKSLDDLTDGVAQKFGETEL